MISDDEMESDSAPDMIPAKGKIPTKADEVEDEVDDEDDEEEPDEFRVEKVLKHDFTEDGTTIYQIKWLGYDKKADLTWEPIENLENAMDLVEGYHDKIGGAPIYAGDTKSASSKKKGGKPSKRSASAAFDSPAVEPSAKKRGRKSLPTNMNGTSTTDKKPQLPDGSWENHVLRIQSILEETNTEIKGTKSKSGKTLLGLIEWNDGRKTQHPLNSLRTKCPQKLLDYYEQHL
ncbi:hypothetical protein LTR37_009611 [Vermiconidia calcicola]|uniref:Uncharacterized protein n=1 Tax=Vermiconidia calcicola TaxID=1690605 RepID=A0ACC3N8F5_9PEZI|nr:hypothetical protein LTR37_009611 [Vermiconidia calcicola]